MNYGISEMKNRLVFLCMSLGLIMACDKNTDFAQGANDVKKVSYITLNETEVNIKEGESITLIATIHPEDATNKSVNWISTDVSIAVVEDGKVTAQKLGNTSIIATTEDGGKTAICIVVVDTDAVDMGTWVNYKNIKWSTCNLGASKPEEYGDYYAWGETEPKQEYSKATYKWEYRKATNDYTKYNDIDNIPALEPEDDVAHVKLGGKWRMPTLEEVEELKKCKWVWTSLNGVAGMMVYAANGNSIFIPLAGEYVGSELHKENGYFWTSTWFSPQHSSYSYSYSAWGEYFSRYSEYGFATWIDRYFGLPVRPVTE